MLLSLLVLPVVDAVDRLVWGGTTPLKQCEETTVSWSGGTPPYNLQIRIVDPNDYMAFLQAGATDRWLAKNLNESSFVWRVDYASGNGIIFGVEDSSDPQRITGSYAGALTIKSGSDNCELVPVPSSSVSAAASSPTSARSSSQEDLMVKTIAESSPSSLLPTGSMQGGQRGSGGSSTNVGAIVGGVVGGVLGLALIIGVAVGIWLCTRRRHRVKEREEKEEFIVDNTADAMQPMEAMETAVHPITPSRREYKLGYDAAPQTPTLAPLLPRVNAPQPPIVYAHSPLSPQRQQPHVPFAVPGRYPPASPHAPPSEYASDYAVDAGPVREQHPPRYDPRWSRDQGKP